MGVVRNPYDRCLSKFYYDHRKYINKKDYLNDWVKSSLKDKLDHNKYVAFYYPAYNYVFDKHTGNQVVDYILKYETLGNDFDELMKEFSLNVTLNHVNGRHSSAALGVEDLSP